MSWNIKTPGDFINGPLTVAGTTTFNSQVTVNSTLQVTGNVAGQGALIGRDGASGGATYSSNTGNTNLNAPASGKVRFNVNNGTFAGEFDTTGNFGIGATPIGRFDIYNTGSDTTMFIRSDTTRLGQIVFRDNADSANQGLVRYDHLNDRLSFTANGAENLYLFSNGDVRVQTGNVVMATSGKGIDFSATSSNGTSEILADYEEGTWTPVLRGVTTAGTYTFSYGVGKYTKIGRLVMVSVSFVDVTQVTAGSGAIQITGLPFTIPNDDPGTRGVVGELLIRQCNALSTAKNLYVQGSGGSAIVYFNYFNGTDDVNIDVSTIISGQTDFGFTLNYNV
jgi:hypothetical protein